MKIYLYLNDASETNSLNSNPSSIIYWVIMGKLRDLSNASASSSIKEIDNGCTYFKVLL